MEKNLVHSNLDFLKILEKYTLESKLLACQKYSSRIMSSSMVDMRKAYKENIMPWEIEAFAAYSLVYDNDAATEVLDGRTFAETITLIRNYWLNCSRGKWRISRSLYDDICIAAVSSSRSISSKVI